MNLRINSEMIMSSWRRL